jgi:hypothetical protein
MIGVLLRDGGHDNFFSNHRDMTSELFDLSSFKKKLNLFLEKCLMHLMYKERARLGFWMSESGDEYIRQKF